MESIYKTIVVKLSGEALADEGDKTIYDRKLLKDIAHTIHDIVNLGTRVGVVVGAGNIWRGRLAEKVGIERSTGDYMGMLGTIINALALQSAFEEEGMCTRVMSAIDVPQVCEPYIRRKAMSHLEKGRVVIFAGGTGNPYFTTDSTATLRALDIGADAILMGAAYILVSYEPELIAIITTDIMLEVMVVTLLFGIIITYLCAYISINKYLRMKASSLYYI